MHYLWEIGRMMQVSSDLRPRKVNGRLSGLLQYIVLTLLHTQLESLISAAFYCVCLIKSLTAAFPLAMENLDPISLKTMS